MSLRFLRETPLFRGALTPEWPAAGDFYWRIVRTGDFDESEELDILWRHDAVLGWNFIWLMNGASILGVPERPRVEDADWLMVNCWPIGHGPVHGRHGLPPLAHDRIDRIRPLENASIESARLGGKSQFLLNFRHFVRSPSQRKYLSINVS